MDARITHHPVIRLAGHATRVPLIHEGVNPHIQAHIASLPDEAHIEHRLVSLVDREDLIPLQARCHY